MIAVDTSAIVAIVFGEPEREVFVATVQQADQALISTASVVETRMVVHGRRGERGVVLLDDLLRLPTVEIMPPGAAEMDAAYQPRKRCQPPAASVKLCLGNAFRRSIPHPTVSR